MLLAARDWEKSRAHCGTVVIGFGQTAFESGLANSGAQRRLIAKRLMSAGQQSFEATSMPGERVVVFVV